MTQETNLPRNLLEKLDNYPAIQKSIRHLWGTLELRHYFEHIIVNGPDRYRRNGFTLETLNVLLELSKLNDDVLENFGLLYEPLVFNWNLPKNF